MNAVSTNNEFIEAFAWTIIHSLWQVVLLASLYFIFRVFLKRDSKLKYISGVSLMISQLFVSIFTFYLFNTSSSFSQRSVITIEDSVGVNPLSNYINDSFASGFDWMNIIVVVYLIGILFFIVKLGLNFQSALKLKTTCVHKPDSRFTQLISKVLETTGINKKIEVLESIKVNSPVVIGWIKPVILLPVGFMAQMTTEEIELILYHEIAHIKRHDYLVNIVQRIIESLYFFHPLMWIISAYVRYDREVSCDLYASGMAENPIIYAKTLVKTAEFKNTYSLGLAFSERSGSLFKRIKTISEMSNSNNNLMGKLSTIVILIAGFISFSWYALDREPVNNHLNELPTGDYYQISKTDTIPSVEELKIELDEKEKEIARLKKELADVKSEKESRVIIKEKSEKEMDESAKIKEIRVKKLKEIEELTEGENFKIKLKIAEEAIENLDSEIEVIIEEISDIDTEQLAKVEKIIVEETKDLKRLEVELQELDDKLKDMDKNIIRLKENLEPELKKDGYIKKDEKLKSFTLENGYLEKANDVTIKKKHREKYKKIVSEKLEDIDGTIIIE